MHAYDSRLIKDIQRAQDRKILEEILPLLILFLILCLSCVTFQDSDPRIGEGSEKVISDTIRAFG